MLGTLRLLLWLIAVLCVIWLLIINWVVWVVLAFYEYSSSTILLLIVYIGKYQSIYPNTLHFCSTQSQLLLPIDDNTPDLHSNSNDV